MYVLDTLAQELPQIVDNITDRIASLQKALPLLEITIDSKYTDSNNTSEHIKAKQLQQQSFT